MEPKKYEYIDSLRGIAILLVILTHSRKTLAYLPDIIMQFVIDGQYGVQLFFIVSAYTLTLSFYSRIDEPNRTKNFFIRRFFRIAPLFYLAIIAYIIVDWTIYNNRNIGIFEIITNITFTNGFFPQYISSIAYGGWSIATEFCFYFLLPFICIKIRSLNSSILFVAISLLSVNIFNKLLYQVYPVDPTHFSYFNIISQLPIFALGILSYWVINDKQKSIKPITLLVVAFTILFYCYFNIHRHFVYGISFFVLLLTLTLKSYKVFSNKILSNIGKVSFSMYIIHFPIVSIAKNLEIIPITNTQTAILDILKSFIIVSVCSFLLSLLTYRFIERPGQNIGRKLIKNKSTIIISLEKNENII